MQQRAKHPRARWAVALTALVALALVPASANAQYTPPPPERGFHYIFDGSASGSDASFDKWVAANGATAMTLEPSIGAMNPNTSGFGMRWYPVRPIGDAVVKLEFMWPDIAGATPNGGIMVRFPDPRYSGTTAEVLAEKPTGYNYDLCPSAAPAFCGRPAPAPSTTYSWAGGDGPYPPPGEYSGVYCARNGPNDVTGVNGVFPATNASNANNHEHWLSVFCGHEIQVNESLQNPGIDGIKTGSVYGFANLNAKQARTYERQTQGVWHTMEIRLVGQQYTVLVDGNVINQYDNAVPKVNSRLGDPPTPARQFPRGYFGVQTHGGTDRIFYREIRVKDLTAGDIPRNVEPPEVGGSGRVGKDLTCGRGEWTNTPKADFSVSWYRSNIIGPDHPRFRAPSQSDLGDLTAPPDPRFGTLTLPFVGPLKVGEGKKYTPTADDVGKLVYCQVSANNDGATTWKTASAPSIVAAD
jgi:3-keto-disaccharide hydrolase